MRTTERTRVTPWLVALVVAALGVYVIDPGWLSGTSGGHPRGLDIDVWWTSSGSRVAIDKIVDGTSVPGVPIQTTSPWHYHQDVWHGQAVVRAYSAGGEPLTGLGCRITGNGVLLDQRGGHHWDDRVECST